MVRPKDEKTLTKTLHEQSERFNREHPIIDTRWFVVEITPAYNTGGYYDQDVPESRVVVSKYFKSKKKALEWMNNHEPDEGKTLHVMHENLREYCYTRWGL